MTDHTKHTVFDFAGEANARSLDLHAAALEALREAGREIDQARACLHDAESQVSALTRDLREWQATAVGLALGVVLLTVVVVVLVVH